jgi:hypothetical protein
MVELEEQLRRYGDAIGESLVSGDGGPDGTDGDGFHRTRPATRRSRRRVLLVAASLVVAGTVAAAALAAMRSGQSDAPDVAATGTPTSAVFDTRTDTVLVFSDGIDGITALDLDAGVAARRVIDGERAGDQPFRINLVDDHLVVGWGEIYAAPLDGGRSTRIDTARYYIPAAEPGQVWTVIPGPLGQGMVQIQRVTMDGNVVVTTDALDLSSYTPLYGVPGGLVVAGPQGLAIWEASSGSVSDPIGAAARSVSITSDGTHLAWCDETCQQPHLVDLDRTGPPTAPAAAPGHRVALSPDGQHLAALRSTDAGTELVVTDLATGDETLVATTLPRFGSVQWTDDGQQLFYASASAAAGETTLGRYDVPTGSWQMVDLDLDPGHAVAMFVPVERDPASALLAGERTEPGDCPEVGDTFPSGRTASCAFPVNSRPGDR